MTDILIDENVELSTRKEQASQLNIDIEKNTTLESIEQEIVIKLESGMKDLKNILNEINTLEFELN